MAAARVNIPSIVLSGGPMLDGWHNAALIGSGTVNWEWRKSHAQGQLSYEEYVEQVVEKRRGKYAKPKLEHQTPWLEIKRICVG